MAPYRVAQFNALARRDVDLLVVYLAESSPLRHWEIDSAEINHEYTVLRELQQFERSASHVHLSYGLHRQLRTFRPSVVVAGGWDQVVHLWAYAVRRLRDYRFLWWVEGNRRDFRAGRAVTERMKRGLVRGSDGILVPGRASRDYVQSLGCRSDRIFVAHNAVDSKLFAPPPNLRRGRTGSVRLLFVGRLEASKGLPELMEAWKRLSGEVDLTIVGEGSMKENIVRWANRLSGPPVRLLGYLASEALAREYARADVFVFPSRSDPWGMVLNEALASGLPVVTTRAPGAVDDLLLGTGVGLIAPVGDPTALSDRIQNLIDDPALRLAMGDRATKTIMDFTPEAWAENVEDAVRFLVGDRPGSEAPYD
jgi:glycosyltransferase involved in cell wall biosynthesis